MKRLCKIAALIIMYTMIVTCCITIAVAVKLLRTFMPGRAQAIAKAWLPLVPAPTRPQAAMPRLATIQQRFIRVRYDKIRKELTTHGS